VTGIALQKYPSSFGALLSNQTAVIQLTTEAILKKSKHSAYLALLADPVIDNIKSASKVNEYNVRCTKRILKLSKIELEINVIIT
jgi:alpha-galactosidase/6-phospho-beta-glucosidase family protein